MPKKMKVSSQDGFGLVTILIAMGIGLALVSIVSTYATGVYTSAKYLAIANEKADLENFIKVRTSCSKSKENRRAHPNDLFDRKGNTIGPLKEGTMEIKKWQVKVTGFNNNTNVFTVHASNSKAQQKRFEPLFKSAPFVCL